MTGAGSLFKVCATERPIADQRTSEEADAEWEELASLALVNEGYLLTTRLHGCLSTATSAEDVDGLVAAVGLGVASALLLTTFRRRPEIGIMRSFGISERFVLSVFMLQGALIGIIGSVIGCLMGFGFSVAIQAASGGRLPVDPSLGQYDAALLLAAAASIAAALWPARAASRIDPVEAISQ